MIIRHVPDGQACIDHVWEQAYQRFETPEEEVEKFVQRLRTMGLPRQPRESRVLELFCGRGGGLVALKRLGFLQVEGLDLSLSLLEAYIGDETLHLADCRQLPLNDQSYDIAIVQGGLHHLSDLDDDLPMVLTEVRRILKPGGLFYMVEPWPTMFLSVAHAVTDLKWIRRCYPKGDALAIMTEREHQTYYQWLKHSENIYMVLSTLFEIQYRRIRWGKIMLVARPK